jgi:DNA methylase
MTPNLKTIRSLKDLEPDAHNANKHTPRGTALMENSIRECGYGDSMTVDRAGRIISGNQRAETLADLGMTDAIVVQTDGTKPIIHQRIDLDLETDPRATALAIRQNRVGEVNLNWDVDVLQALQTDGVDLSRFWEGDELAALYAAEQTPTVGQTDPDAVPAARHTDITLGDVFALGRHRLACGDARRMATIEAAMAGTRADGTWMDPPWGVSYVGKTAEALVVHGDAEADLAPLLREAFAAVDRVLKPGAAIYVAHPAGRNAVVFGQAFLAAGWHFHQGLVWVKDTMVLGHSDFQSRHESIMYGWKPGAPHTWLSDRTQVTVFMIDRPKASPDHPTSKPVALVLQQIGNNVAAGGVIVEPFAGSGTTLIAAEQLGISCRAVELSPAYCQVIIDRWEAFVGNGVKAVKVGEIHACPLEK